MSSAAGPPAGLGEPRGDLVVAIDARVISDRFPGIGRYVYELVRALPSVDSGLRIVLLVEPDSVRGLLDPRDLVGPRCSVALVNAGVRSVATQWRLPRVLAEHGADVFHATYWVTAYRPGVPSVLSLYDLIGLEEAAGLGRAKRGALKVAIWLALRSAREVVTLSDWSRDRIVSQRRSGRAGAGFHFDPTRVTTTHLAAGASFAPARPDQAAAASSDLALPERYVLYLGSAKPHKNLLTLVKAWRIAGPQLPGTDLVLAGAWGHEGEAVRAAAAALPNAPSVRILGAVPDHHVAGLLGGAEVFAFPSVLEGFGLPPLEAMACGVPVVAARAASLPEVLGDAGILVEPMDSHAWADALVGVVSDPALQRRLRASGLARASHFAWEETARETAAVYRRTALSLENQRFG